MKLFHAFPVSFTEIKESFITNIAVIKLKDFKFREFSFS